MESLIPSLVLQPIVENAIRYCVAQRIDKGVIEITAENTGPNLRLIVADNGPGTSYSIESVQGSGTGLANIRERLQHLYGDMHRLTVEIREDGGFVTTMEIPFKAPEKGGEKQNRRE
jgi:sensor histidine kinase YesM